MGRFLDGIIAWSISHRYVVIVVAVALVVAGLTTMTRASLDVLPDFAPPRVVVQTEAKGLATPDVEQLVTRPLELVLLGTPRATTIRSSSSPGLSVVTLFFENDVNIYQARQFVNERLRLAQSRLPEAASPPQLAPIAAPLGALLKICITSSASDKIRAARELRAFADWTLRPRLLAVPGVTQVFAIGGEVERVEIRPDEVRLRQHSVTVAELTAAVEQSQAMVGAGFVESGESRVDVQTEARLTPIGSQSALEDTFIGMRGGSPVRIRDVAEVARAAEPRLGAALYDGRPAVYVQVTKLPWAGTLGTTHEVERVISQLKASLPAGGRFEMPVFRQASFVSTAIGSVGRAMLLGSILVVFVLLAFLRSGRLAVISLTAIPLSLLAALTVLVRSGASINSMTLGGLAIAVGEVVDDAIVDVENIWRRLRENARLPRPTPALDVIRQASREVRGSVVFATIAVLVALVPVVSLEGIAGRIFSPLALSYMLAIGASLLVALTVTPALCAWLLPKMATGDAELTPLSARLLRGYSRLIRRVVEHPGIVLFGSGALALSAMFALTLLGGRFLPEFHEKTLIGHLFAVPGTSLDESIRLASRVDAEARPKIAVHTGARAGRAELDEDTAPVNRVEMDFVINPKGSWDEASLDIAKSIAAVPGIGFAVEGFLGERIHEVLSGETSPVVVKVYGSDLAELRRLVDEITPVIRSLPSFGELHVEPQIDVPQLRITPDRMALARFGTTPSALAHSVLGWRQGYPVTQILGPEGRTMNVVIAGPLELRDRSALASIPIATASGDVPLSELASLQMVDAPSLVNHEAGERRISIGVDARGAALSHAAATLERILTSRVHLPSGYRIEVGGEAVARSEAALRLGIVGALVLVGIFVLLGIAFGSLRDAVIVLLNIPLGLIGGVLVAAFASEGISVAGFIGFITLFGIITRNGIMLVSHMRHLDATEPETDPVTRILRASEQRLLPILMTAITAGLGLLPLAISIMGAGSEIESPMAIIVCGGLATATALNMLVLPTIYVWLARRSQPMLPTRMNEAKP